MFRLSFFLGSVALLLTSACGTADDAMPERVIDAHMHADFSERGGGTLDSLEAEWGRARVVGAVVHLPRGSATAPQLSGRVRYCAGVAAEPDSAALDAALGDGTVGCFKIYLGYVPQYANDPRYQVVYGLAERYRVPVVFHTGDTSSSSAKLMYADPLTVDEVAVDHPAVTFVIAHCGNPWIESAAEVAYNVRAYARAIPREHRDAVFYGNAARVFGLGETPVP